jgi:hypothetical protein
VAPVEMSEAEVLRYSRQILLRQVGGEGQARLLATRVHRQGVGQAVATAFDYLVAGGVQGNCSLAEGPGLSSGRADIGPALLSDTPRTAWRGDRPWVLLGSSEGEPRVIGLGAEGCPSCFLELADRLGSASEGPLATLHGALGALVFQRCVLDPGIALISLGVASSGAFAALPGRPCTHR